MDRRERYENIEEVLRVSVQSAIARVWTCLPGIVSAVPGSAGGKMTVDVQPAINGVARNQDGSISYLQMPKLLDCPIVWQGGGGVTAVFPIAVGDECLVHLSSRCIDAWWAKGGVQNPTELRMHSLSDGFALVGLKSQPNAFTPPAGVAALMSNDGSTYVQLNPTGKTLNLTAPTGITLNGVTIDSSGNVTSPATVTATTDVVGGGKHLKTHTHSGVTTGSGTSGPPS